MEKKGRKLHLLLNLLIGIYNYYIKCEQIESTMAEEHDHTFEEADGNNNLY